MRGCPISDVIGRIPFCVTFRVVPDCTFEVVMGKEQFVGCVLV